MFWPNKKLISLFKKLKKKYKLALLSNIDHPHKKYLSKKYKLKDLFPIRIYSCDVKTIKPGSKIYKIALKKLKTKPEQTIFIDDGKDNVIAAKKLGIHAIQFQNNGQLIRDLKKLGVRIK